MYFSQPRLHKNYFSKPSNNLISYTSLTSLGVDFDHKIHLRNYNKTSAYE